MIEESRALEGYKIFVAEDDHDIQVFMKGILERCGASVTLASNGSEAMDVLLHETFDVALMDIEMPICDGFEVVDRVRRAGYGKPIVAISARYFGAEFPARYLSSFDERLPKPVTLPRLIETIKQLRRETKPIEFRH